MECFIHVNYRQYVTNEIYSNQDFEQSTNMQSNIKWLESIIPWGLHQKVHKQCNHTKHSVISTEFILKSSLQEYNLIFINQNTNAISNIKTTLLLEDLLQLAIK